MTIPTVQESNPFVYSSRYVPGDLGAALADPPAVPLDRVHQYLDELTQRIVDEVVPSGLAFLTTTRIRGRRAPDVDLQPPDDRGRRRDGLRGAGRDGRGAGRGDGRARGAADLRGIREENCDPAVPRSEDDNDGRLVSPELGRQGRVDDEVTVAAYERYERRA